MAEGKVVDETKNILEKMSESKEEVSLLSQDLSNSGTVCQQMRDNLKELRQSNNKIAAGLEDNRHLKSNIKEWNKSLLSLAQKIYTYGQEVHSDLKAHEAQLVKNEELFCRNEEKLEKKTKEYAMEEEKLKKQLEAIEKQEMEDIRKRELEDEALAAENEELRLEYKMLLEKIGEMEEFIKTETATVTEDEQNLEKSIEELQRSIKIKDDEINEFPRAFAKIKETRDKLEMEAEATLLELDMQIAAAEAESRETASNLQDCEAKNYELKKKIEALDEDIKRKEEFYTNFENKLSNIEIYEQNCKQERDSILINCKKAMTENEEMYKRQVALREQLKLDILDFQKLIEAQQEYDRKLMEYMAELEVKKVKHVDLEAVLQEREKENNELDATIETLRENNLKGEIELVKIQCEIAEREQMNRKLEEDVQALSLELIQLDEESERLTREELKEEEELKELDNQINNLTLQLAGIEPETVKKGTDEQERKTSRHWDSDSSIEDAGRRYSDLVKQKIKRRAGKRSKHSH